MSTQGAVWLSTASPGSHGPGWDRSWPSLRRATGARALAGRYLLERRRKGTGSTRVDQRNPAALQVQGIKTKILVPIPAAV